MRLAVLLPVAVVAFAGCAAPALPGAHAPGEETVPGAILRTDLGEIRLALFPDLMPRSVEHFSALARRNFYEGSLFDRVVDNFVIQGGDRYNDSQAPAEAISLETHPEAYFAAGTLGWARELGPDTATSVFFITEYPQPHLRDPEPGVSLVYGEFAAFGQVVTGMEVVKAIAGAPTNRPIDDRPRQPIVIRAIEITDLPLFAADAGKLPLRTYGRVSAPPYRVSLESEREPRAGEPAPHFAWYVESQTDRSAKTGVGARMRVEGAGEPVVVDLAPDPLDPNVLRSGYAFPQPGRYRLTLTAGARDLATFDVEIHSPR